MAETRNSAVLRNFVAFCEANPGLRFWQALRAWAAAPFILISTHGPHDVVPSSFGLQDLKMVDTFYREGRDQ
jgi:hypothetical protein